MEHINSDTGRTDVLFLWSERKKSIDLELTPGDIFGIESESNMKEVTNMTIKEVSEKFDITADTLRYYERVGLIPPVARNASGNRDYQEKDISWVEHTVCMRNAGVPIEALIEYVKLVQLGDATFGARLDLLQEQYDKLEEQRQQIEVTMERLRYKISKYEEAVKTGKLVWDGK